MRPASRRFTFHAWTVAHDLKVGDDAVVVAAGLCDRGASSDPDGATRTTTLGSERMARKLRDAMPGGEDALHGREASRQRS
ncbi:MAG TPA: hypothetical protein VFI54_02700 [Solirubrobacteraceae bacterium]|nr:hypothetical protein [Solirubrobacteraceae bacterium]